MDHAAAGRLAIASAAVVLGLAALSAWYRRHAAVASRRCWPHGVQVRPSLIPNAGNGLFATRRFSAGEMVGEYHGQVLTLLQATRLEKRDYLMGGFGLNVHIDARFALNASARYINDHFDAKKINARFEKLKPQRRAIAIATRDIRAGEEIYASYGETYWRARGIDPLSGAALSCRQECASASNASTQGELF
uniref:SET domain-containing protein n=1 Tax=Calcidiscus leptoporus TaxID=127549 RepID=A0A7S0P2K7_9EUKA|mmetsp:Transcript_50662/g.116852  ORF Transcript_50662/g.116852 Transcript_50662/m.116852 type:complete len:192 (+) Transcript_50662:3-578(+)